MIRYNETFRTLKMGVKAFYLLAKRRSEALGDERAARWCRWIGLQRETSKNKD